MRGMGSRASDHDPTAARRCIFKHLFMRINLSPSSRSDGCDLNERLTMDRSIVTVDHFDPTVTPKKCINKACSSDL